MVTESPLEVSLGRGSEEMPLITKVLRPEKLTAQRIATALLFRLRARPVDFSRDNPTASSEAIDLAEAILDELVVDGVLGE